MTTRTVKGKWAGYAEIINQAIPAITLFNGGQTLAEKKLYNDRMAKYGSRSAKGIIYPCSNVIDSPVWDWDKFNRGVARCKAKKASKATVPASIPVASTKK